MRIDKTIKGEVITFYIKLIPNTMTAEVRMFGKTDIVIGKIDAELKYIHLPETYLSNHIDNFGRVKIGKLKINKSLKNDIIDYNNL